MACFKKNMNVEIEPGVIPVCNVLNTIPGVRTIYSCEGHPRIYLQPFIRFVASSEIAFKIHALIENGFGHGGGQLEYCWKLTAQFEDDKKMVYTIQPNDVRLEKSGWYILRKWGRLSMDKDLFTLAKMFNDGLINHKKTNIKI